MEWFHQEKSAENSSKPAWIPLLSAFCLPTFSISLLMSQTTALDSTGPSASCPERSGSTSGQEELAALRLCFSCWKRTYSRKRKAMSPAEVEDHHQFRFLLQLHVKSVLPVPPAMSKSCAPGWGFMTWRSVSFHKRWIPRLMASFMTSYFCATFSNTLYTEKE